METIFLNVVNSISEGRFWIMPLFVICIFVSLACVICEVFEGVWEEMKEMWIEVRGQRSGVSGNDQQ